ncbi:MAG TPA: hypothetical protein VGH86_04585 [Phenylobacterium sp.]
MPPIAGLSGRLGHFAALLAGGDRAEPATPAPEPADASVHYTVGKDSSAFYFRVGEAF